MHRRTLLYSALATVLATPMAQAQQSISDQVRAKAELAVRQFQQASGGPLDFTERSLERVELLLNEASRYFQQTNEQDRDTLVELLGCYVLQVARTEFSGDFFWHQDLPLLVVGEPLFHVALFPFPKVRGRLAGDKGDNIPFFYQGFAERARAREAGKRVLFT